MKKVTWHLVEKLVSTDKESDRVVQLLEGLSILCSCKGTSIKQNQSESLVIIIMMTVLILNYRNIKI